MMTTMTDKLLARAAEYQAKADALRLAAAEMNGHALNGKQKTAVSTLDAAIALRKGQREAGKAPRAPITQATMADRQATIRAFLEAADGPQTTHALRQELEARGQNCSTSWVLKVLREMKDVHKVGRGVQTAWGLGKAKRASPGSRLAEKRAVRERIAQVLAEYDRETPKLPILVAQKFGLTVQQSGFAPLVHQGYLKKRKDGYVRTAKTYVVDKPAAGA
jgi:hypothetical protein